jgi:hypothetical protein
MDGVIFINGRTFNFSPQGLKLLLIIGKTHSRLENIYLGVSANGCHTLKLPFSWLWKAVVCVPSVVLVVALVVLGPALSLITIKFPF